MHKRAAASLSLSLALIGETKREIRWSSVLYILAFVISAFCLSAYKFSPKAANEITRRGENTFNARLIIAAFYSARHTRG